MRVGCLAAVLFTTLPAQALFYKEIFTESFCENGYSGVQCGNVCCEAQCGTCGGAYCDHRPGGGNSCCQTKIWDSEVMCMESGAAPCIVEDLPLNSCLDPTADDYRCIMQPYTPNLQLEQCGLTDDYLPALAECISTFGRSSIVTMNMDDNKFTTMSGNVFTDMTALTTLMMKNNDISTLPATVFESMSSLKTLQLQGNDLTSLDVDLFKGLTTLTDLWLDDNALTVLPNDIFRDLQALSTLLMEDNELTCCPDIPDSVTSLTPDDITDLDSCGSTLTTSTKAEVPTIAIPVLQEATEILLDLAA